MKNTCNNAGGSQNPKKQPMLVAGKKPNWKFQMKDILLFLAMGLLQIAARADVTSHPSMLQFRLVTDVRTAQTEEMTVVQPAQSPNQSEVLNVQKEALLDGSDVKSAKFGAEISRIPDNVPGPMRIFINFTDSGAKRLAEVTSKHIGDRLAIVIDGKLYSAPRIYTPITGGQAHLREFHQGRGKKPRNKVKRRPSA